jgi:hypothetical protein
MASRLDLAQQYMDYFAAQNTDETLAMMSDDVVLSNPMTGTTNSKAALQAQLAAAPQGGGGINISWGAPEAVGDNVKIVGTGSPFGPVRVILGFDDGDLINRIDIGLA